MPTKNRKAFLEILEKLRGGMASFQMASELQPDMFIWSC